MKLRWDFWKLYANYRLERADDEEFRAQAADLLKRLAMSNNLRMSRFLGAFGPA